MMKFSNCEVNFASTALERGLRLDSRKMFDMRLLHVHFGVEFGCTEVELGASRAAATVSYEVAEPKAARPNEGFLYVNVDLSPMAGLEFHNVPRAASVEVARIVERTLKESHVIDVESLCLVRGMKAWCVRLQVTLLNHEGNAVDLSVLTAILALAHSRRPDSTLIGETLTVHTLDERPPVPLTVFHWPVTVTFGITNNGSLLVDPSLLEEAVLKGKLIVGVNKHRELCSLNLNTTLSYDKIKQCTQLAIDIVSSLVPFLQDSLRTDSEHRKAGTFNVSLEYKFSQTPEKPLLEKDAAALLHSMLNDEQHPVAAKNRDKSKDVELPSEISQKKSDTPDIERKLYKMKASDWLTGRAFAGIGEGGPSQWDMDASNVGQNAWSGGSAQPMAINDEDDKSDDESEEEDVVVMTSID